MTATTGPRFPDYGDDGDLAGARRGRKAFRLSVAALVILTGFSYFSERFLRYSQPESNFLSGITLPRESGRVLLKSAIQLDAETSETPTPKYTQALAVRQENDVALETYGRAHDLDPTNALFSLRYGCRLFLLGRYDEAAAIFQQARSLPPPNALPRYLQAASLAQKSEELSALRDAIVMVSRANNTRDPLVFPRPIWFSGYPQHGTQYALLSREIYTEVCAPLYTLSQHAAATIRRVGQERPLQDARTWLEQIERMGDRLVRDSEPRGTLQAIAGITIQLQALGTLEQLYAQAGQEPTEAVQTAIGRQTKLRQALELLNAFEGSRDDRIAAIVSEYYRPLMLSLLAFLIIAGAYLLARLIHMVLRYRKSSWTVRHSFLGKSVLGFGCGGLFGLLGLFALLQRIPGGQEGYTTAFSSLWWALVAVLIGFGLIYPALRLASPEAVSRKSGRVEEMPDTIRLARQTYRRVYAALVVRYYGILSGAFLCTFCIWVIAYRIVNSLYPWQINLLANGLLGQEQEVVQRVVAFLS